MAMEHSGFRRAANGRCNLEDTEDFERLGHAPEEYLGRATQSTEGIRKKESEVLDTTEALF